LDIHPEPLATELRYLLRRRAAHHPDLIRRVGPQLRLLCQIREDTGPVAARRRLRETVDSLLRDDPETRLVILGALGLQPGADQRTLRERQRWLADQLKLHERTVRRRTREAVETLVRLATEDAQDDRLAADAWRVQSVQALLQLDDHGPELSEERTVLVTRDGIGEISTRFSLPRPEPGGRGAHSLLTTVTHGGRIRRRERLSDEHFRFVIELPRRYRRGETFQYGIRFTIPPDQAMVPHYALVPLLAVESLDLIVRFDHERPPLAVWRLDGVAPRMLDNPPATTDDGLHPDRFGELALSFRQLRQGFGYGACWRYADRPA
jgi:hypothetical protein